MKKMNHKPVQLKDKYKIVLPSIAVLLIVTLFPFLYTLNVSLHKVVGRNIRTEWPWVGLRNFINVISDKIMWNAFLRTVEFIAIVILVELVLGFMLALIFNQESILMRLMRTILIIPMVITPVVVGLMWKALLKLDGGLVNDLIGFLGLTPLPWLTSQPIPLFANFPIIGNFLVQHLNAKYSFLSLVVIDIWQWTPFVMLIFLSSLQSIPQEVKEAAQVDGAKYWQQVWFIIMPMLKPTLIVIFLLRTIDALKVFDTVYALYGSAADQRLLNVHVMNIALRLRNYGQGAALSILILIATSLISQWFVKFVNQGAVNE